MPSPDKPPLTRAVVLRAIGFAAAIACGAVAAWLVVTGEDQQTLRIGMLVGLWGLVLGAYSMFGARRGMGAESEAGREIALREGRVLERQDEADARRDWESRLERLINREISTAVGRETAALRNEIAHLRQELLDQVGGQLRLERIETTRVIGSDLEALQHEVRQLKDANGHSTSPVVRELLAASNDPRLAMRPVVEPARVRPVSRPTAEVEADVRPAVDETESAAAVPPTPVSAPPPAPTPPTPTPPPAEQKPAARAEPVAKAEPLAKAGPPSPAPVDAAARVHQAPPAPTTPTAKTAPTAPPSGTDDPFAALPRLSRFSDFEPTGHGNGNGNGAKNGHANGHANGHHPADSAYTGRRRRADEVDQASEPQDAEPNGRHANHGKEAAPAAGGRRRRHDDEQDDAGSDLLSRLLSRENSAGH